MQRQYCSGGGGVGMILEIHVILYSNGNGGILEEVFVCFVLFCFFVLWPPNLVRRTPDHNTMHCCDQRSCWGQLGSSRGQFA